MYDFRLIFVDLAISFTMNELYSLLTIAVKMGAVCDEKDFYRTMEEYASADINS